MEKNDWIAAVVIASVIWLLLSKPQETEPTIDPDEPDTIEKLSRGQKEYLNVMDGDVRDCNRLSRLLVGMRNQLDSDSSNIVKDADKLKLAIHYAGHLLRQDGTPLTKKHRKLKPYLRKLTSKISGEDWKEVAISRLTMFEERCAIHDLKSD